MVLFLCKKSGKSLKFCAKTRRMRCSLSIFRLHICGISSVPRTKSLPPGEGGGEADGWGYCYLINYYLNISPIRGTLLWFKQAGARFALQSLGEAKPRHGTCQIGAVYSPGARMYVLRYKRRAKHLPQKYSNTHRQAILDYLVAKQYKKHPCRLIRACTSKDTWVFFYWSELLI